MNRELGNNKKPNYCKNKKGGKKHVNMAAKKRDTACHWYNKTNESGATPYTTIQ